MATLARKPKIAVWKFASCDGCQLTLLNCEDALLDLAGAVDIAYFPEASRRMEKGPFDISLIEGSVSSPADLLRVVHVRKVSKVLITIGACATAGGVQSIRNWHDVREYLRLVYQHPDDVETLEKSTPIGEYVRVEHELRGCPINRDQLLELLTALLFGRQPQIARHSLCIDCRRLGIPCVMVSQGTPCLGGVTQTGCGALCPSFGRGCYGCFGPMESAHPEPLSARWKELGRTEPELVRAYRTFNAHAAAFRRESEAHES